MTALSEPTGRTGNFLRGLHEERTEVDPPAGSEPVFVKDVDDTPKDFL